MADLSAVTDLQEENGLEMERISQFNHASTGMSPY
jgi:hypothetical protein